MEQQQYKVGAYCRLSRDDESVGESGSITVQKEIIRQYCESRGLAVFQYYQDDGFTGLNYDRPDFQKMLGDIEAGKIDCVVTKDLSRLGRDYIMTGYYTEMFFPDHNVRYIAIGDGYDSHDRNSGVNDYAPFKFIVNDMYARDLSKKQRASRYAKNLNGEIMAPYAPYGYRKDPKQKNHWLIDEDTAPIVRMIFEFYAGGMGRGTLRDLLNEKKILTPAALLHVRGEKYCERMEIEENRYQWNIAAISRIVKNEGYLGNAVHYRYRKANHKSRLRKQSKENQLIVSDVHEPIIDTDTWERVQKRFRVHPDRTVVHENIFMGIAKCADCGKSLNFQKSQRQDRPNPTRYLLCATYKTHGKARCTTHYTNYTMLCEVVRQRLNQIIGMVRLDEGRVRARILREKDQSHGLASETAANKITKHEKRLGEITRIYAKLYEDRALEIVSDENFRMLSGRLQGEQAQLTAEIQSLQESMAETEKTTDDVGSFVEILRSMEQIDELDADILNTLIDRIDIGEKATDENGEIFQRIDISYKFIGKLDL